MSKYISESHGENFIVYYNALKAFIVLLLASSFIIACAVYVFFAAISLGFEEEFFIYSYALFGAILLIFVVTILRFLLRPLKYVLDNNRAPSWGGSYSGLQPGLYTNKKYLVHYNWNEVKSIRLIEGFTVYWKSVNTKRVYDKHVALINVTDIKQPVSGEKPRWGGGLKTFTQLDDGSYLIKQYYPKNQQEQVSELISKYSRGTISAEILKGHEMSFKR